MNTQTQHQMDVLTALARVNALDLGAIKVKLMDSVNGEGWSREKVQQKEVEYKRFLALNLMFRHRPIVPSRDMDTFWHYHILDTTKYFEDCQAIFGYYFHHFPYFGMRGQEDAAALAKAFAETKGLYEVSFGEPLSCEAVECANACTTPCEGGQDPSISGRLVKIGYAERPAFA